MTSHYSAIVDLLQI